MSEPLTTEELTERYDLVARNPQEWTTKSKFEIPLSEPLFCVTARGLNEQSLETWAIEWLTSRGWKVSSPHDWETPKELCLRLGISSAHLSRSLRKAKCPKPFDLIAGQMGRIVWLKSTKDLEDYLVKFKSNRDSESQIPESASSPTTILANRA